MNTQLETVKKENLLAFIRHPETKEQALDRYFGDWDEYEWENRATGEKVFVNRGQYKDGPKTIFLLKEERLMTEVNITPGYSLPIELRPY